MKDIPILFTGENVRAILDDRKRVTRRVIKPQPPRDDDPRIDKPLVYSAYFDDLGQWWIGSDPGWYHCFEYTCPYQVGQRLWVREMWTQKPGTVDCAWYAADFDDPKAAARSMGLRWRPSIHMPRWTSRLTLEVTASRPERVQEITRQGCEAEGIAPHTFAMGILSDNPPDSRWKFIELWDSIYKKRGYPWDANPWVWVVEFKRVTR